MPLAVYEHAADNRDRNTVRDTSVISNSCKSQSLELQSETSQTMQFFGWSIVNQICSCTEPVSFMKMCALEFLGMIHSL